MAGVADQPALATHDQLAAERILLQLLADPDVKAEQARIAGDLRSDPAFTIADGKARLEHAIDEWTTSLILRELTGDAAHPSILWNTDDTPHTWYGYTVPGAGIAGDNPDHIYRGAFLDGSGHYEITGKVDPAHRPAQFSFEITPGAPGHMVLKSQNAGHPDMGGQIAMRTDRDLKIEPDGSFRITLGGEGDGPNHLPLAPGPISLGIRDVLSDWTQQPNRLTIRRLDAAPGERPSASEVRRRVLADLPGYIKFWSGFKDTWFGGLKPNLVVGPVPRDGHWGFQAAGRYHLAPGEAMVVTTTRGAARYTGIQVTDPWMVAPNAREHQTSVNTAQTTPNADGSYTYVISPTDPGVANWVDTGGLRDGFLLIRWQGFTDDTATAAGLLRDFEVVKLDDIAAGTVAAGPPITPPARQAQLAKRDVQYTVRVGG